jgi:hypothetical protein
MSSPLPARNRVPELTPLDSLETNVADLRHDLFGTQIREKPPARSIAKRPRPDPAQRTWEKRIGQRFAGIQFEFPPASALESSFRHSHWQHNRKKVYASLVRTGASRSRVQHFAECGSACWVQRSPSENRVKLSSNCCHDRWCMACGNTRSRLIAANLERHLADRPARFITLTLKHRDEPLTSQIDRLFRSFRTLRSKPLWKKCVTGGAAFLEVKRSKNGQHWHPHIHVLVEGEFIRKDLLSAEWLLATGDSHVVDVRFVRSRSEVVSYVAKYASKPLDSTLFEQPAALDEAVKALKGRRLCTTLGAWRGVELEEMPEDPGNWVPVCSLDTAVAAWRSGEEWAKALLCQVFQCEPADVRDRVYGKDSS